MTAMLQVDADRLWADLMELKEIGGFADAATGLRGVRRLALTDEDAAARHRVIAWMREAGMSVRIDRIGNVYATRPGREPGLPSVLLGSHIDTVATGGAFDGTLGVLGGIEVVRTLNDHRIKTRRSIEVGFFTEEEGVRFGTDMLGSAVTAGRLSLDHAHKLTDDSGVSVAEELIRTGFDGPEPELRPVPHAYLECHIEQGPILAAAGVEVGIVSGVQSISWQRLTLHGEAAHAGTTPIEHRRDAGLAASAVVLELRRMCDSGDFGALRATVGRLTLEPGQTNVIPSTATMTIDLRNPDDAAMTAAERHLETYLAALPERYGVGGHLERMARTAVVPFDAGVQDLLAATAEELGLPYVRTMSGAGHDAQEIASTCPAAMIFVAGEHGGISHTPREFSTPAACAAGVTLLANAARRLADQ
jgi:N-carbamoyl-L-amino-acid hydrolase